MKKLLLILGALIAIFIVVWALRMGSPLTPNNPFVGGLSSDAPWWERLPSGETPQPDDSWTLDPEIPGNYIPVLGAEELYMVVNENGAIKEYRHRIKQTDGSWVWETVNPDIPQNYEPVEGLDNVYRVVEADGAVHYYRYHRNSDDTYYFIEVDEQGNEIEKDIAPTNNDGIPANYVRVDGTNVYAIYNEHGVLIGYKERVKTEDGSYGWRDCDAPSAQGGGQGSSWGWGDIGNGGIPGAVVPGTTGQGGNITIINGETGEKKGYAETRTTTETREENGFTVVYETTVTYEYDLQGSLIKTSKEGPTEINRFPTTAISSDILPSGKQP